MINTLTKSNYGVGGEKCKKRCQEPGIKNHGGALFVGLLTNRLMLSKLSYISQDPMPREWYHPQWAGVFTYIDMYTDQPDKDNYSVEILSPLGGSRLLMLARMFIYHGKPT